MKSQTASSPLLVGSKSWLERRNKLRRQIADKMHSSRTGGATMRMPPTNFSSIGLARLFGAVPDDEPKTPPEDEPKTPPDDQPKTPPHATHSETAIIVGAVSGVVGLALLLALGGYTASWWRKNRIHPEFEQPHYEIQGKEIGRDVRGGAVERVDLQAHSPREQPIHELGPPLVWTTQTNAREDLAGL